MRKDIQDEVKVLNDIVFSKFTFHNSSEPKWIEGKQAISEMSDAGYALWREIEWPAFYVRFILHQLVNAYPEYGFNCEVKKKHYLFKKSIPWDIRVQKKEMNRLILLDKERMNEIFNRFGGLGIIIFKVKYLYDVSGEFRQWHHQISGGYSEYVQTRIDRGALPRIRKSAFRVLHTISVYYNKKSFIDAYQKGCISETGTNMRNADGTPRKAKYKMHIPSIPENCIIGIRNYTWKSDDFNFAFEGCPLI